MTDYTVALYMTLKTYVLVFDLKYNLFISRQFYLCEKNKREQQAIVDVGVRT